MEPVKSTVWSNFIYKWVVLFGHALLDYSIIWTKFTSFSKGNLAEHQYLTSFKLEMQACIVCLTAIVKMCIITRFFLWQESENKYHNKTNQYNLHIFSAIFKVWNIFLLFMLLVKSQRLPLFKISNVPSIVISYQIN